MLTSSFSSTTGTPFLCCFVSTCYVITNLLERFTHECAVYIKSSKGYLYSSVLFNRNLPTHMTKEKNEHDKKRNHRIIFSGIKYFYAL